MCYEELPAVPQPAYLHTGMSPEDLLHVVMIDSLPVYQQDDPYKRDLPPPVYTDTFHASSPEGEDNEPPPPSVEELRDLASIDISDSLQLITSDGDDGDEYICMQPQR